VAKGANRPAPAGASPRSRRQHAKPLEAPAKKNAGRRSKAKAAATFEEYQELYKNSPVPALSIGRAHEIKRVNDAASELLNDSPERLLAQGFRQFVRAEDRALLSRHLAEAVAGVPTTLQILLEPRSGERFPVQIWVRHDKLRDVSNLWLVDLRPQQRASEQAHRLAESERAAREESAAKDRFIAVLSHELRAPLTPMLAAASAFRSRDLPPDVVDAFDMIARNAGAEARLIDDLLDVNRIIRGRMRIDRAPCDVHEIMRDAVETLRPDAVAKQQEIVVSLAADRPHASVDSLRLRQVFVNLLKNAVKFTPPGGQIHAASWNGDETITFEVADDGIGVDPAALPRLFEPFMQEETSTSGGLGLGLAIAKGLVALHEGRITAHSRGLGLGTRFVVELPLSEPPPAPEEHPQKMASSHPPTYQGSQQPCILLVEDHADTALVLSELLMSHGFKVQTAASISEARRVDLAGVHLIVSDLGLPDGTGLDLMRELRARARLPAIALSGYGMRTDVEASKDAGFDLHLTKPVNFERLLTAIQKLSPQLYEQASSERHSEPLR
jgi:signal transduction histidine kinase/ActR/RegA family two-component response regulator